MAGADLHLRRTALAVVATVLERAGGVLMLLLIARLFGPDDFGHFAALLSFFSFFQVLAELGQEPVLVRLLAQDRTLGTAALVDGALGARLLLSIVSGCLLLAIGVFVFPDLPVLPIACTAAGLVACAGAALRAFFRNAQRIDCLVVVAVARIVAFGAALVLAWELEAGIAGAMAAWAAAQLAASTASFVLARSAGVHPRLRWHGEVASTLAASGWPLALNAFLLTVTLRVGQLVVLRADGPGAVAALAAGSRVAEAFALLPEALMLVLLPLFAAGGGGDLGVRAVRYLALLALPVVLVTSIAAPTVLALLYGPAYVSGTPALRILAWLALLGASGTVFTNLLIARGYERVLLLLNGVGSVLTLGLSLVLVPREGFVGAAVATLVASVLSQALLFVLPGIRAEARACIRPLWFPVLATLALSLVGSLLAGPELVLAGGALAALVGMLVATGTIDAADWALVRRALTRGRGTPHPG